MYLLSKFIHIHAKIHFQIYANNFLIIRIIVNLLLQLNHYLLMYQFSPCRRLHTSQNLLHPSGWMFSTMWRVCHLQWMFLPRFWVWGTWSVRFFLLSLMDHSYSHLLIKENTRPVLYAELKDWEQGCSGNEDPAQRGEHGAVLGIWVPCWAPTQCRSLVPRTAHSWSLP